MPRKPFQLIPSKIIYFNRLYRPKFKLLIFIFPILLLLITSLVFYRISLQVQTDIKSTNLAQTDVASRVTPLLLKSTLTPQKQILITSTVQLRQTPYETPSPTLQLVQVAVPNISDFQTCLEPCDGFNSRNEFPESTTKIYVQWRYDNIPLGANYIRKWSMDGAEWVRYDCSWNGKESGIDSITLTEPKGLRSGMWEVTIIINGTVLLNEQIYVSGDWDYWDPAGNFNSCYGKTN